MEISPYATAVRGRPSSTAFENKIQKLIAVASDVEQNKYFLETTKPKIKQEIAPI